MSANWQWSDQYQNYYMVRPAADGQPMYVWAQASASQQRHDSPTGISEEPPEHIQGTSGSYESLDPSYYVRSDRYCHDFFRQGRVLSMLWSEGAGQTSAHTGNGEAYTQVRFGEYVYSGIRRFIVLSVPTDRGFVYACPISTYSRRGVLKPGCDAEDHAAVHFNTSTPYVLPEEVERGMANEAIMVESAEPGATMDALSRINFGKTVAIEKNVKVKDIGRVTRDHMSILMAYWNTAKARGT